MVQGVGRERQRQNSVLGRWSWRCRVVSPIAVAVVAAALSGCGSSNATNEAEKAFRRWNELAMKGDPGASAFVCADPGKEEAYDSPITSYSSGFAAARSGVADGISAKLHVEADGKRATADFTDPGTASDGDEEDVFVSLVYEQGRWKVCRVQITAAGGFG